MKDGIIVGLAVLSVAACVQVVRLKCKNKKMAADHKKECDKNEKDLLAARLEVHILKTTLSQYENIDDTTEGEQDV